MIDRSKLSNSFEFVVTAGARARQLLAGSVPRVAVGEHKKTTVAQQEVMTRAVEKTEKSEKVEPIEAPPFTSVRNVSNSVPVIFTGYVEQDVCNATCAWAYIHSAVRHISQSINPASTGTASAWAR